MIPRSFPNRRSIRKKSARRVNRRAAAFSLALAAMLATVLPFGQRAQAADTVTTVNTGATDLSDPNSYSTTTLPTATVDVLFTGTYTTPTFNVNGAALTYGTLDDTSTQALTIGDTTGTPGSITLSSVANLTGTTGAGNAADVLFVKSGSSLTINNIALNISAGANNNIDNAGTLTFGATSTLSLNAGFTTSFTGAGTTTISGTIASTTGGLTVAAGTLTLGGVSGYSGATTLTAGTLNLNSATAIGGLVDPVFSAISGTSALNLNGGTLNNTSGAAVALSFNAPITIGGNFTFGTAASTSANNLNLGTGAITLAASRNVTVLGTGTTLTMGGTATYTGAVTAAGSAGTPSATLTVNGLGNTLSLGSLVINTNSGSTAATVFNFAGSGNTMITGPVTNGTAFANGLAFNTLAQTGTLSLLGTNTYTGLTTIASGTLNLGGDNTAATGGLSINTTALNLLTGTALGTGTLGINSGSSALSINNTSGAALTEVNNPAITFNGNFGFNIPNSSTATSANNLNLGTGAVAYNNNTREAFLGGTGTTLTFGGTLSNTSTASTILTVFGSGNTLVLGALNLAANTSGTQTFNVIGNGNVAIPGVIANGGAGTNQFFISGTGTYTLGGTNTFTAPEQISGGTLVLNYSTNNTSKLATASTLVLGGNIGGGTVTLSGGSFAQTVGNTNLNYGAAAFTRTSGTSTLALGGISRAVGASVNFAPATFVTTTTGNANGILGGYATYNAATGSADWAANVGTGGTAPTQFTGYSAFTTSNVTPGVNGDGANPLLTGSSALTGNIVTNSLKINSTTGSAASLTIPTGNALVLTSGGLLYTGSDAYAISGGALRTNAGTSVANDLIVQQYGAGTLTLNSAITDGNFGSSTFGSPAPTSLTKAGPGTLILGAANSYSGATYVNVGTLQFGAANSVLPTSALVVNGTVDLHGFSQNVDAFNGTGTVVNNGVAATLAVGSGNSAGTYYGAINNGTGTLGFTKNGSNIVNLYGVNTYSGATVINSGTLNVMGQFGSIANSTSITVTGNGTLNVGDLNGPAGRLNPATALTLGGANGGGNFNTQRLASGTQNLSIASLNIGVGNSGVSNALGTTADSGYLVVTGASGSNYTRAAGGFFTYASGGGDLTIAFSNQITGAVSGTGTSQIVIGGISNGGGGSSFMGSAASINGLALGSTSGPATTSVANGGVVSAANAIINLTNNATTNATNATATTAGPLTINAIQFSSSGNAANTDTLTLGGTLTVSSGGILAGNGTAQGGVFTGGSITTGSAQDLWVYNQSPLTIASPIADSNANAATNDGTGGISKGGSALLTLSGASTFAGPVYLTQGVLGINNTAATGTASALGLTTSTAPIYMTGATLRAITANLTTARPFALGGGADTNTVDPNGLAVVLNGVISSQGTLSTNIATGSGQLVISSGVAGGTATLNGANTFTGGTSVLGLVVSTNPTVYSTNPVALVLANSLALQNSTYQSAVQTTSSNGGALQFSSTVGSNAFTFGGLGGNANIALQNNAVTPVAIALTIGNNNQNASSAGVLSGAGSLVKVGTGTQTFTNANTFTGTLTINGGTVNSTSTNFASITGLTVSTGGTMLFSGNNTTHVSDTAPVTMGGGALNLAPLSREGTALNRTGVGTTSSTSPNVAGLGMLTLTANSSINFLGTSGTLVIGTGAASAFDPTNAGAGNFTLTVFGTNFGTNTLGSENINDRLVFNMSAAPTTAQLNDIVFNQGGTLYTAASSQIGTTTYYDIIPGAMAAVPEPSTWVAGLLCLGTLGFSQRRRIGSVLRRQAA